MNLDFSDFENFKMTNGTDEYLINDETATLFFLQLLEKYLPKKSRYRQDFMDRTKLKKDIYANMRGVAEKRTRRTIDQLLAIAYGLGITSDEAKLLFALWGPNPFLNLKETRLFFEQIKRLDEVVNQEKMLS